MATRIIDRRVEMAAGTILGFGGEEDEVTASLAVRRTAFEALPDEIIEQ